jgi:hypothetical protein
MEHIAAMALWTGAAAEPLLKSLFNVANLSVRVLAGFTMASKRSSRIAKAILEQCVTGVVSDNRVYCVNLTYEKTGGSKCLYTWVLTLRALTLVV